MCGLAFLHCIFLDLKEINIGGEGAESEREHKPENQHLRKPILGFVSPAAIAAIVCTPMKRNLIPSQRQGTSLIRQLKCLLPAKPSQMTDDSPSLFACISTRKCSKSTSDSFPDHCPK